MSHDGMRTLPVAHERETIFEYVFEQREKARRFCTVSGAVDRQTG